jgi:hypothetical protein
LLLVAVSALMSAQGIFILGGAVMLVGAGLAILALPATRQIAAPTQDMNWEYSNKRALAGQSALRGVVLMSSAARETKGAR